MAIALDALLIPHRLGQGHAQRDADILHRVVAIDMQIPLGLDVEVDQAMAGDLVEHVFQEGYPGGEPGLARAVQIDADADLGLIGGTLDAGASFSHNCLPEPLKNSGIAYPEAVAGGIERQGTGFRESTHLEGGAALRGKPRVWTATVDGFREG